jgi:hypothetical protein
MKLRKTGLEQHDSVADQIREMLERFKNRLTLDNPRLVERYIKGELHLLIQLIIGSSDEKFVAILQRAQPVCWGKKDGGIAHEIRKPPRHIFGHQAPNIDALKRSTYREQQSVLVDTVQLIEDPEVTSCPSVVWFEAIDCVYGVLPQALYFSRRQGFVLRGARIDGEMEIAACGPRRNREQLLDQMIEGGPEILDDIARNRREVQGNRLSPADVIDWLASLRIALGRDFIWIGAAKRSDLTMQVSDVLFGPFDFYLNQREPFIGGHIDAAH